MHLGVPTRAVLTGLCFAQAWMIVFVLRIGPVVAVLDARAGRGVHSGDLLAIPLVGVAMLLLSEELAARSQQGATRRSLAPEPVTAH